MHGSGRKHLFDFCAIDTLFTNNHQTAAAGFACCPRAVKVMIDARTASKANASSA